MIRIFKQATEPLKTSFATFCKVWQLFGNFGFII